ncbi:zinc peptidase [Gordoniibacillus kamchatkensis]|uniref:Zinc peptidase n=1 Tax=Gordoniibacillus kamchatkensis TaxID=1590651 RepID=A0ABR5A3J7_9BACL|nr:zinc peptidase [Paenibacillus sp. VKM B-2647]
MARRIGNLVAKYKTNCPFQLSELLRIHVKYAALPDNVRGLYCRTLRRRFIVINEALSEEWQRFVCAHELGHDRLHRGLGYYFIEQHTLFDPRKFERQANEFAVRLLTFGGEQAEDETAETYCMRSGVPREMAKYVWS